MVNKLWSIKSIILPRKTHTQRQRHDTIISRLPAHLLNDSEALLYVLKCNVMFFLPQILVDCPQYNQWRSSLNFPSSLSFILIISITSRYSNLSYSYMKLVCIKLRMPLANINLPKTNNVTFNLCLIYSMKINTKTYSTVYLFQRYGNYKKFI